MRSDPAPTGVLRFLSGVLLLFLSACTGVTHLPAKELYWPAPPPQATIQWVEEIRDRHDAGIGRSMWQRVADLVTGREEGKLGRPYGIFVDDGGKIFIVDTTQGVIHLLDPKQKKSAVIPEEGRFRAPIGITGDGAGRLYVTDAGAGCVYRYDPGDRSLVRVYVPAGGRPTGIAFSRGNNVLYVVDTANHQVVGLDTTGKVKFRFGSRGERQGDFNYPTDLFVDARGRLYVTDALNARIQVFSSDGTFLRMFGGAGDGPGEFAKPKGIAVDSRGNVYVSDALQDLVNVFDASGRFLLAFGSNGVGEGEFWMPAGIHIRNDTIYVADTYNNRVQLFRYLGSFPDRGIPDRPGSAEGKENSGGDGT